MTVSNTLTYAANAGKVVIGGKSALGPAIELVGGDAAKREPVAAAVAQEFLVRKDDSATITGATAANPVVITATAHGLLVGDVVRISGVVGMVELNGNQYTLATIQTNSFELRSVPTDDSASADIDGTGFTGYTSGGTATLVGIAGSVTISLP